MPAWRTTLCLLCCAYSASADCNLCLSSPACRAAHALVASSCAPANVIEFDEALALANARWTAADEAAKDVIAKRAALPECLHGERFSAVTMACECTSCEKESGALFSALVITQFVLSLLYTISVIFRSMA